jgi:C1A family cysteine protease
MTDFNTGSKKIDWKKKGLGWIPDYPDLRDYKLIDPQGDFQGDIVGKDGNIILKGNSGSPDDAISASLIEALKRIVGQNKGLPKESINSINDEISDLEIKIFGDIEFKMAKVFYTFRYTDAPSKNKISKSSPSHILLSRNDTQKCILAVKMHLVFFALSRNSDGVVGDEQTIEPDIISAILKPSFLVNPVFDRTTEKLVRKFQAYSNKLSKLSDPIDVDGIMGLATYERLNRYLSYLSNASGYLENCYTPIPIAPFSLVPHPVLPIVLEILEDTAKKHYSEDSPDCILVKKYPQIKAYCLALAKDTKIKSDADIYAVLKRWKDKFSSGKTSMRQYSDLFLEVFNDAITVTEPLVTIALHAMSPIAIHSRNATEISSILKQKMKHLISKYAAEDSAEENFDFDKLMALNAIKKMRKSCKDELKNLEGNPHKYAANKYKMTLYLYVLLHAVIEHLFDSEVEPNVLGDGSTSSRISELLDLSKKEAFELIDIEQPSGSKEHEVKEFFPSEFIRIPISKKYLNKIRVENLREIESDKQEESKKNYLFLPYAVDLSYWCSTIEDQGSLNACTSFAGLGLFEYFANRSRGKYTDGSALFLYKSARNLMNLTGDVGASVRETMKAIALFGIPPETTWPYNSDYVDEEPPPFCYAYAQSYQALKYFRLDHAGISRDTLLLQVKAMLAAGFPSMFGFTIYSSAYWAENIEKGHIPIPNSRQDKVMGGHAVVAVGYDDYRKVDSANSNYFSQGAFLIRNSWGTDWGHRGYGWLPYDYVLQGFTRDWWSILKTEWFNEDDFGMGARGTGEEDPGIGDQ